jgi:tetratricopeptide (TPR) repeat protein
VLKQGLLARRVRTEFERAVALDPNDADAHEGLFDFYNEAPGMLGGSEAKALEQVAIIRKLEPAHGVVLTAKMYERQKKLPDAERVLVEGLSSDNDALEVHRHLLGLYASHASFEKASGICDAILAKQPGDRSTLLLAGMLGAEKGVHPERAEAALKAFLELPPLAGTGSGTGYPLAHYRLGLIYEQKHDLSAAQREFQAAVTLNPQMTQAQEALSRVRK